MSHVATVQGKPSRLSYSAVALAAGAVVVWVLAGIIDDGLYAVTGLLGVAAFGLGIKALRAAKRAGSNARLALGATIVGGLLGGAVIVATVVYVISDVA
jgi:hypothetical protein